MISGTFLSQENRRKAWVRRGERVSAVYISTGIDIPYLREGSQCYLREAQSENRSTSYDLYSIYDGDTLVCIDAKEPVRVAAEWVKETYRKMEGGEDTDVIVDERYQSLTAVRTPLKTKVLQDWSGPDACFVASPLRDRGQNMAPQGREFIQVLGTSFVDEKGAYLPVVSSKALRDRLETLLGIYSSSTRLIIVVCRDDAKAFYDKEEVDPTFAMLFQQIQGWDIPITVLLCTCDSEGMKVKKEIPFPR